MATNTPNMNLLLPTIGVDSGLVWEQGVNSNSNVLDGHNHSPGSGAPIQPSGINITSDLSINNNNLTSIRSVRFTAQGIPLTGAAPDLGCLYVAGVDLYYNDEGGNVVRLTSGGAVNATSSGLVSGTASATFVSSVLTVIQSAGVGAAIDAATYILRYNGSYPSPSGNYIALQAPSSLSGGYALTLPTSAAAANGSLITSSTAGILSYSTLDGSTLVASGGVLSVGSIGAANITSGSITTTQISSSAGITGGQIASATLTGSNIAANINLPGTAVEAGSKNVVVSNTNAATSLAIIRGGVTFNGTADTGEGFSSSSPSTGVYSIAFATAFASNPVITVTCRNPSLSANCYNITAFSTTGATITITNTSAVVNSENFFFIAIGPRV